MVLLYNNDEYINKPLTSIVVILVYLIILIYIIILINSIYNFATYFSNKASYNILISEDENSKNITESYKYRTLNYIKCFEDNNSKEVEKDDKDKKKKNDPNAEENEPSKMTTLAGLGSLISANEKFSNEKDFSLLFEYNLYNIIFKLICIILFIIFCSVIINYTIEYFLKIKQYKVEGNLSVYNYIVDKKNYMILMMVAIFTVAIFSYLSIYKLYFIDTVYNEIYTIYKSILQLDIFILDECNKINIVDNYFFVMLKNIIIKKSADKYIISPDYESYIIENNIEKTENPKIKVSKYFILGFYKYIININKDIDIINKINNFIIHKNNDLENNKAISLRDYLPISLDEDNIETKINQNFTFTITDPNQITLLNSKKQNLISILSTLDTKLNLDDVVFNIFKYICISLGLSIFIVFLILFFIYRNNYKSKKINTTIESGESEILSGESEILNGGGNENPSNGANVSGDDNDRDNNFFFIREFIDSVIKKIRRNFFKTEAEKQFDKEKNELELKEAKKKFPINLDFLCAGKKQENNS